MYLSCRILHQNDWLIQGRHVNYGFTIGCIGLLSIPFYNFPIIHWSVYSVILIVFIHYKTSSFSIRLGKESVVIKKRVFGFRYFKQHFRFNSFKHYCSKSAFQFSNGSQQLTFSYEEFEFDEFGFKINSNYSSIGSLENSNLIFTAFREWIKYTEQAETHRLNQ